ncbi:hypothetical protein Nepgr_025926 [Nepenthes gracilis]|uniref:Red chlorophyll catabolite reductase n=1 Tax=Nepenthes gracilis TaxID=150966 RepID=A0AAD3T756_NEPGR|nr:hypothetical protein Nepgr_025926 [Nepenthes gracilis]
MATASSETKPNSSEFMEFPYASPPVRDLMVELVSTVESRLGSQLLPCSLPPDVQRYRNESGTSQASLHVRSGIPSSPIDFILGSWLHSQLPTGAALSITSLSGYLNDSTDAPNFLIELIQSSATSAVFILDLPPRRDLILHPDYLNKFYEDTELDKRRQLLQKLPELRPYMSPALFIRCAVSPTAILTRAETNEAGGPARLEEIVRENISTVAREVLGIWLDHCVGCKTAIEDDERSCLRKRDQMFKRKIMEVDLASNFPRLFGRETADRVLGVLGAVFGL